MSSKYNIKIAPGAIVCNECELKGDITIGTKTVIHPKAKIIAESGPIIIGKVFFWKLIYGNIMNKISLLKGEGGGFVM